MALAGHYKLDIHVMSLLDKNMNDYTLNRLMKSMSGKPLVLLEDIDSAGVGRDFDDSDDDWSDDGRGDRRKKKTSNVTLSGLLNAIDGVGAPEGQVLIMTTNHIDELDDALIRAGRVDVKVKLDWCSKSQTRKIFIRMYEQGFKRRTKIKGTDIECVCETRKSPKTLEIMSQEFADQIPEYQLSPAELQDFILMRKSDPQRAIDEVKDWAQKVIEEREKDEEQQKKDSNGCGDSENGDGNKTPPPSFEEVEKEKEGRLGRWMRAFQWFE